MEPEKIAQDPMIVAALTSVVTAFLMWLSGKGWPLVKEGLGLMGQREKEIAQAAKEGPIMVLEEVKRQLADTKVQAAQDKADYAGKLAEVLIELKELRKQHHECETKHAALQSEVSYLKRELEQIRAGQ